MSLDEKKLYVQGYGVLVAIRQLARLLSTPAKVGFYISVPDVLEIAESLGVPAMPRNDRQWFFEEVMKAALDMEKLDAFLEELTKLIDERAREVATYVNRYPRAGEYLRWSLERVEELKKRIRETARIYQGFLRLKKEYSQPR
ncbi:hypothetical protein Pisl_1985 [Pyrobaculum islandicum DSM 4184]|uniref:Uncharacterized protein n=1 Tax=Pyrobaculum islandicum (strain DSM 4184 / JCM 9189 / GEO3) TaxID=384616 RepID=A1RW00_PYRIL|nr:hypothetical protein [Pyrobaculum islandicum]ABL89132.1 hypothetical protein Pisl_1985 [Pyrobaculum islandicum DSM 4184]